MFIPAIQKTKILVALAVFNYMLFFIASSDYGIITVHSRGYEEKKEAVSIMNDALEELKRYVRKDKPKDNKIDLDIDPDTTGLIFNVSSKIKTGTGDLKAKQTTLKPNFAALIVDLLFDAGVLSGDTIAVGMTGSMPGADIGLYSACKAMNLYPVVISSVGASQWGATDPKFTWIDLENHLFKTNIINQKSIAASLGGLGDCLRKKGTIGGDKARYFAERAIRRNDVPLIRYEVDTLKKNLRLSINKRMKLYTQKVDSSSYSAYVNIGGGAASIGVGGKKKIRKPGVLLKDEIDRYRIGYSVVREFSKMNVPIIHILHIPQLVKGIIPYGGPTRSPEGEGPLFSVERYNLFITFLCLLFSIGSVIFIGFHSHKQINERTATYEPESIL